MHLAKHSQNKGLGSRCEKTTCYSNYYSSRGIDKERCGEKNRNTKIHNNQEVFED